MDVIELQRILNDYLHYLKAERGLSENTVSSYGLDLQQFINYLSERKITDLNDVDKQVIVDYLDCLMNKGKANSSIIRCVTSLRKFFQSMKQDEKIQDDPMISIETPKGEKHLPEVLSTEEVEMLLNAPLLPQKSLITELILPIQELMTDKTFLRPLPVIFSTSAIT